MTTHTKMLHSTNPATGEIIASYSSMDEAMLFSKLEQTHQATIPWRATAIGERCTQIHHIATLLRDKAEDYAQRITQEMGKPIREARGEIEKCANLCEWYADNAEAFLADELIETEYHKSYITYQPLGILLAIMPWNFPFWQVFRAAIPALLAGNGVVLKHASNVSGSALDIEAIFQQSALPEHLFSTVLAPGGAVTPLIHHPHVQAVTLTASVGAGRAVASEAGKALKKSVMELGGSDPYIILEDADVALAAKACVASRTLNAGQSCIAAKRFIAVDGVYDQFLGAVLKEMQSITLGNPLDETTDMGPMASLAFRDTLHQQVIASVKAGAECAIGGEIPTDGIYANGAYYPPTLLTNVTADVPAYHEELFGPVASLIRARDTEDAMRIANDTVFGLGGAIFSRNVSAAEQLAATELHSGAVFINDFVRSDARLPFGGIGESGYGRELSAVGLREFTNVKSIAVS